MKRLLVITYYWPPTGGSGVQRWVKFCKYLPQFGWQPVIYTPENPERQAVDESLLADIPSSVEVIKSHINEPYEIYRRLTGGKHNSEVNPLNSQKKSIKQKFSLWIRGNLFIPDPRVTWVKPSVKYLRKYLCDHPVDAVVTTGPPQSVHLIGRDLKRATGIRWIADFRDPWTEMFYYKHLELTKVSDAAHHRQEKSVLDEADMIISVSPPVREDFQQKTKTPVVLITNGFDEDDFASVPSPIATKSKFTIVHTGLFAADGNPLCLWDALSRKCAQDPDFCSRLQIRLAGKTDAAILEAIKFRGLSDKLVDLGYLPHDLTIQEQRNADILILPLRQEPEYAKVLPGKIFEYLAARRPILGIGQEDGAAAEVLRDSGAGEMFNWDKSEELLQFIEKQHGISADIDKYSRRALTRKLTEIL